MLRDSFQFQSRPLFWPSTLFFAAAGPPPLTTMDRAPRIELGYKERGAIRTIHAKDSFCYGCSMLFDTTRNEGRRHGSEYTWDEIFTMGPDGDPVRREKTSQLPDDRQR